MANQLLLNLGSSTVSLLPIKKEEIWFNFKWIIERRGGYEPKLLE